MATPPKKNTNFEICTNILKHCNTLFIEAVNSGHIKLPKDWNVPVANIGLYLYTCVEDLLYFTGDDETLLKQLGFHCELENRLFMPWFRSPGIQICPIDLENQIFEKPKCGLVRDVPIFFKKIHRSVSNETQLTKEKVESKDIIPIFVTSDPIDTMLLIANGFLAIGLGTSSVLKGQLKYLSQLQRPLIYLGSNNKKNEQCAELFVLALERYCKTYVFFTPGTVRSFILNQDIDPELATSGVEFISNRIMNKNNGKSDYERNIDIIETSMKLPKTSQLEFTRFVKLNGATDYAYFSQSLRFMADLMDAKVGIDQAREITNSRFGTTIFIQSNNQIKLK
ncbi:MAG: hypothetical protein ACI92O_000533 [Colwellia sp.]|jgi:hypothetical protein